jgi:hypothetical protein
MSVPIPVRYELVVDSDANDTEITLLERAVGMLALPIEVVATHGPNNATDVPWHMTLEAPLDLLLDAQSQRRGEDAWHDLKRFAHDARAARRETHRPPGLLAIATPDSTHRCMLADGLPDRAWRLLFELDPATEDGLITWDHTSGTWRTHRWSW